MRIGLGSKVGFDNSQNEGQNIACRCAIDASSHVLILWCQGRPYYILWLHIRPSISHSFPENPGGLLHVGWLKRECCCCNPSLEDLKTAFPPHIQHHQSYGSCYCSLCVFRDQLCRVPRHIQKPMSWTHITQTLLTLKSKKNHKDCFGTHYRQLKINLTSNWCPIYHWNKNTFSYKSYFIKFEECYTRCADIIKIQEIWKETGCLQEKNNCLEIDLCERNLEMPEKKLSNNPKETQWDKQ